MKKAGYLFSWMILAMTVMACAQETKIPMDKKLDLYLLIGQSNMAGRGLIEPIYAAEGNEQILMLTKDGTWLPAKHPLHFDKPNVVGVGPGLSFAMELFSKNHHPIGLIPCAVGGSAIESWEPGAYDSATKTHPYDDAIQRLKMGLSSGGLKGILWHQGEADSAPEKRKNYLEKLCILINRLRTMVGNPNLPFVAGEIGAFNDAHSAFNQVLNQLPNIVPNTAVASSMALKDKGDHLHFDGASATELGKRYAIQMELLQKQIKSNL